MYMSYNTGVSSSPFSRIYYKLLSYRFIYKILYYFLLLGVQVLRYVWGSIDLIRVESVRRLLVSVLLLEFSSALITLMK